MQKYSAPNATHAPNIYTIVQFLHTSAENQRFEISYSIVAPSGGAEKNLNMVAQQYYKPSSIGYKVTKPPKLFKKCTACA